MNVVQKYVNRIPLTMRSRAAHAHACQAPTNWHVRLRILQHPRRLLCPYHPSNTVSKNNSFYTKGSTDQNKQKEEQQKSHHGKPALLTRFHMDVLGHLIVPSAHFGPYNPIRNSSIFRRPVTIMRGNTSGLAQVHDGHSSQRSVRTYNGNTVRPHTHGCLHHDTTPHTHAHTHTRACSTFQP